MSNYFFSRSSKRVPENLSKFYNSKLKKQIEKKKKLAEEKEDCQKGFCELKNWLRALIKKLKKLRHYP
ncbi:MAG: hypothetical protein R6U84_02430 [Candidatus Cloacimonadales bacterium]